MIERTEVDARAARDGVPEEQVWRDWMISHVIAALATVQDETSITFYGGTALCRTWCLELRYSEDVDLLVDDFDAAIDLIPNRLRRLLRRQFPDIAWSPTPVRDRMVTGQLTASSRSIKLQFVEPRTRESDIPTASTDVSLRYSDLPSTVELNVPTPEGFAAMKLMAWHQRQAPRDLVDLAALAATGAITSTTLDLTEHVTGTRLSARILEQRLTPTVVQAWRHQLAHQMTEPPDPEDCLKQVIDAAMQADT